MYGFLFQYNLKFIYALRFSLSLFLRFSFCVRGVHICTFYCGCVRFEWKIMVHSHLSESECESEFFLGTLSLLNVNIELDSL